MFRLPIWTLVLSIVAFSTCRLPAQSAPDPAVAKANAEMSDAALKWWNSLSPDQQSKAGFDFGADERKNWNFIPITRKGLPWKDMTPMQQELGHALLRTGLSPKTYEQAEAIQQLESTLKMIENEATAGSGDRRDPFNYYITIFGKPGGKDNWGWRFEGHHVAFNFTIAGDSSVGAPNFLGSNPSKVPAGKPKAGTQILAAYEDLGRQLITSLDADQRKTAIFQQDALKEIVTTNAKRIDPLNPTGLPTTKMTADQKKILMNLITEYASRLRPELAKQNLDKIKAGFDQTSFAWAGSIEVGGSHYYRVQGPSFLIEYDNTQNNNNHIHAVWRDFNGDFGEDILAKHYAQNPH